jgi:hypothetical protein
MMGAIIKIYPLRFIIGECSIRDCQHLGRSDRLPLGGDDSAYM